MRVVNRQQRLWKGQQTQQFPGGNRSISTEKPPLPRVGEQVPAEWKENEASEPSGVGMRELQV